MLIRPRCSLLGLLTPLFVLSACTKPAAVRPLAPAVTQSKKVEAPVDYPALREIAAHSQKANEALKKKDYEGALVHLRTAFAVTGALPPNAKSLRAELAYEIAEAESNLVHREAALAALKQAVELGYAESEVAKNDKDLIPLRGMNSFNEALAGMQENARKSRVFDIKKIENPDLGWASLHAFEDSESPRLKTLREKYKLDDVVSKSKSQFEAQLSLLSWVHNKWVHDGLSEPAHEDALTILNEVEQGKRFRCVEYSVVLAEVLQAMGYPARVVSLRKDGMSYGVGKGHVITEAWNDEIGKWIAFDGQNNATWRIANRALSAEEVREVGRTGMPEQIRLSFGATSWIPQEEPESERRATWQPYFEHLGYAFDNRDHSSKDNARVDLVGPKERYELLFQGSLREGRSMIDSVAKVYPQMNRVHFDIQAEPLKEGEKKRAVVLKLSHAMPSFSHYQVTLGPEGASVRGKWEGGDFSWPLQPGKNEISFRAVNKRGVQGKPSTLEIELAE